jgi:hypothetical protein
VVIVTNDTSTGANVLVTFQSALATAVDQLLTSNTPGVSIALATINVANNIPGNGIPIALGSGLGVTSGSFTLQYNPSLLTINGVVSTVAGAFTLVSNDTVAGTAVLSLSSPSSLSATATPVTIGSLLATMPMSASAGYGIVQSLHLSDEQLNGTGGPIVAANADGVEVAAYFGDVTAAGGPLSLSDATAVSSVAQTVPNTMLQTIPGFAAFPTLDPAIIGDVALQGSVTSTDAGAILQQVGGNPRITIPYAPIGSPETPLAVHGGNQKLGSGKVGIALAEANVGEQFAIPGQSGQAVSDSTLSEPVATTLSSAGELEHDARVKAALFQLLACQASLDTPGALASTLEMEADFKEERDRGVR